MDNVSRPKLTIDVLFVEADLHADVQLEYVVDFGTQDVAMASSTTGTPADRHRFIADAAAGAGLDNETPTGQLTSVNFAQSTNGVTSVNRSARTGWT
jgi:hypothetical protein